jgi:hypothetical protein
MLKPIYFVLAIPLLLLSCSNADNSQKSHPDLNQHAEKTFAIKELFIDNGEEEGWGADLRLSISSVSETDTTKIYKAISSYEGKNLGFLVSVPKGKEGEKGFAKGITFGSLGSESDFFLATLAKLYKQKIDSSIKFTSNISVSYVNLKEFGKSLGAQDASQYPTSTEYKLFFEGASDEDYAELYVNINTEDNWIEIREKDEEYRPAIIKFLKK